MSTLSTLYSNASSIMNSPQYMRLSELVENFEVNQEKNAAISAKKMSMLQIATEQFIDVLDKDANTKLPPSLRKSLSLLAKGTPLKHLSMLVGENDQLKKKVSDLEERNSILVQMSEDSQKSFRNFSENYVIEEKIAKKNEEIERCKETIRLLQEENEDLSVKIQKLQIKEEKRAKKIEKLEDALYDYDENLTKLKEQLEKMQNKEEKEDFSHVLEENKTLKESNEKILDLLTNQSDELEKQSFRYKTVCKQRDTLKIAVDKLFKLTETPNKENAPKPTPVFPISDNSQLDVLLESLKSISTDRKEVIEILRNQNKEVEDRIIEAFNKLLERKEVENNSDDSLKAVVYSQLMFLHHLINNKEMQKLIIEVPQSESLRKFLIKTFQEEKKFLEENKIELNESESVFANLIPLYNKEVSSEELEKQVQTLQENSNQEQFLFVAQCIVANEILRKYSDNLHLIIAANNKEIKESKKFNKTVSSQCKEIIQKAESLEKENKLFKVALMRCFKNAKKNNNQNIAEICNGVLSGNIELPERELYILKLEKKIKTQKIKFSSAIENYEKTFQTMKKSKEAADKEVKELSEALELCRTQKNNKEDEQEKIIKEKESEVLQLKNTVTQLQYDLRNEKFENKHQIEVESDKLQLFKLSIANAINEISKQLSNYKLFLNELSKSVGHLLKKYLQTINNAKEVTMSTLTPYATKMAEDRAELNEKCRVYEKVLSDNEENSTKDKEAIKEMSEKCSQLTLQLNKASYKLKATEEKSQRDLLVLQKQNEFLMKLKENEKLQIEEKAKEDQKILENSIYSNFYSSFREFVDLTKPVSAQGVDRLIRNIKNKIEKLTEDLKMKSKYEDETIKIRNILSLDGKESVSAAVENYYTETQKLVAMPSVSCSDETKRSNKWEEWAKDVFVYVYGSDEVPKDEEKQRKVLSEIIMASLSASSATRKIEMLRDEILINKKGIKCSKTRKCDEIKLKSVISSIKALVFIQRLSGCIPNRITSGVDASKLPGKTAMFQNFIVN